MQRSSPPNLDVFMNYEYDIDFESSTAAAAVVRFVSHNKDVLEIGAGSGAISRHLAGRNKCQVTALETNPESVEKLKKFCRAVHQLDLNDRAWPTKLGKDEKFDYVVAADVLEHVYDPWTVLKGMKQLLKEDGSIILSLPHASHSSVLTNFFTGDIEYREWGLMDKTHIRFFGLHNIEALYEAAGLSIVRVHFVMVKPEDSEFADRWRNLPEAVRVEFQNRPYSNVYQVVTEAKRSEVAPKSLSLLDQLPKQQPKARSKGLFGLFGK